MSADLEYRVRRARNRLGVGPRAGAQEIRRAFRVLSKDLHPDLGGDQDAFEEVQAAYDLLRSTAAPPVEQWFIDDDEDSEPIRVAYDSAPKPLRRSFQQIFADALRGTPGGHGSSGTGT